MNFNFSITNTELEHLDTFLPEITSLRIKAYQGDNLPSPPSSPFKSSEDFKLFIAREICKCHNLNDIWVNFLATPLTRGQMTYQELTLLMIACYEHDNPTHNCPNTNRSHALITHSLLVLGNPISSPRTRNRPCGFNPPLVYAFFMQAYMHFWDKVVRRIFIHTGKNWLENEGFVDPFIEENKEGLARSIAVGEKVMARIYKERKRFKGITYSCYRRKIEIWSLYM